MTEELTFQAKVREIETYIGRLDDGHDELIMRINRLFSEWNEISYELTLRFGTSL